MRKVETDKDDVLRQYLNAGNIEKAPEGFSSKVMSHIYMEVKPVKKDKFYLVPVVFASVFLLLTICALFVPHSTINLPEFKLLQNLDLSFPELTSPIDIPYIIVYIALALIAIAGFDYIIKTLIRKENELKL